MMLELVKVTAFYEDDALICVPCPICLPAPCKPYDPKPDPPEIRDV